MTRRGVVTCNLRAQCTCARLYVFLFFFAQVLLSVEGAEVLIYNIALVTGRSV